ncbi:MAG: hypothetical protein AAGJ46_08490 [Planctomycetota bacterium]
MTPKQAVTLTLLIATLGCGGSVATLSGKVEYAGQPVQQGALQLQPGDGRPLSVEISEGAYSFGKTLAVKPGDYKVRVFGYRETGTWSVNPDRPGSTRPEDRSKDVEEFIPPKYNYQTELEVSLSAGEQTRDFLLRP